MDDAPRLLDHCFRHAHGPIVGRLARRLGAARLDLAEEAVQEAYVRAVRVWPLRGVPDDPEAWLMTVAHRAALDVLRREARRGDRALEDALEHRATAGGDDALALMFLCAHPALSRMARVALTLRTVGGFGVAEIAAATRARPEAVQQRLVRAKCRLRAGDVSLGLPAGPALAERMDAVVDTLYLLFNEGYSPSGGDSALRRDLAEEAIRLTRQLAAHPMGDAPHVAALLALLLFQGSRWDAREDADGLPVTLAEQDRARWDRDRIEEGLRWLERSARGPAVTELHLLAGIAACHAVAPSDAATDWQAIVALYDDLAGLGDDPHVRLNRAVAVGRAEGPAAGLIELDALAEGPPAAGHLVAAARADCLARLGRTREARAAWRQAARRAPNGAVRGALQRAAAVD